MSQLALHLQAELMWVPGHVGTRGNEIADELDRKGAEKVYGFGPDHQALQRYVKVNIRKECIPNRFRVADGREA